jgi:hypothetical protein
MSRHHDEIMNWIESNDHNVNSRIRYLIQNMEINDETLRLNVIRDFTSNPRYLTASVRIDLYNFLRRLNPRRAINVDDVVDEVGAIEPINTMNIRNNEEVKSEVPDNLENVVDNSPRLNVADISHRVVQMILPLNLINELKLSELPTGSSILRRSAELFQLSIMSDDLIGDVVDHIRTLTNFEITQGFIGSILVQGKDRQDLVNELRMILDHSEVYAILSNGEIYLTRDSEIPINKVLHIVDMRNEN